MTAGGELKTVSLTDGLVTHRDEGRQPAVRRSPGPPDDQICLHARRRVVGGATGRRRAEAADDARRPANRPTRGHRPCRMAARCIFTVETAAGPRIEALTLATGERQVVLNQAHEGQARSRAAHLFFYRDDRLLAVRVRRGRRSRVIGSPMPVLDDRAGPRRLGTPIGDVSPAGLMVFAPNSARAPTGVGVASRRRRTGHRHTARLHEPAAVAGWHAHRRAGRRHLGARPAAERRRTRDDA